MLDSDMPPSPGNITFALKRMQPKNRAGESSKEKESTKNASRSKSAADPGNPFVSKQRSAVITLSDEEDSPVIAKPVPNTSKSTNSPKKRPRSALEKAMASFAHPEEPPGKGKETASPSRLSPKSWLAHLEHSESDSELLDFKISNLIRTGTGTKGAVRSKSAGVIQGRSIGIQQRAKTEPMGSRRADVIDISSDDDEVMKKIMSKPVRKPVTTQTAVGKPTKVIDLT
jgi:hypothetical protein